MSYEEVTTTKAEVIEWRPADLTPMPGPLPPPLTLESEPWEVAPE